MISYIQKPPCLDPIISLPLSVLHLQKLRKIPPMPGRRSRDPPIEPDWRKTWGSPSGKVTGFHPCGIERKYRESMRTEQIADEHISTLKN